MRVWLTYKTVPQWNFTLGMSLSSLVDIMVASSLFVLLQKSRTGADTWVCCAFVIVTWLNHLRSINAIINSLIWYTFETGLLTWFVSDASSLWTAFYSFYSQCRDNFHLTLRMFSQTPGCSQICSLNIWHIVGNISRLSHFLGYPLLYQQA
jgi:hypothetical protein